MFLSLLRRVALLCCLPLVARVADPASLELDAVWDEEWRKNLVDVAIERVKHQVAPKQFQIFDLHLGKNK